MGVGPRHLWDALVARRHEHRHGLGWRLRGHGLVARTICNPTFSLNRHLTVVVVDPVDGLGSGVFGFQVLNPQFVLPEFQTTVHAAPDKFSTAD